MSPPPSAPQVPGDLLAVSAAIDALSRGDPEEAERILARARGNRDSPAACHHQDVSMGLRSHCRCDSVCAVLRSDRDWPAVPLSSGGVAAPAAVGGEEVQTAATAACCSTCVFTLHAPPDGALNTLSSAAVALPKGELQSRLILCALVVLSVGAQPSGRAGLQRAARGARGEQLGDGEQPLPPGRPANVLHRIPSARLLRHSALTRFLGVPRSAQAPPEQRRRRRRR